VYSVNDETKNKGVVIELKQRVSKMTERGFDEREVQAFVHDYPLLSLAAVIATGYAVGRLISRL
jgi:hypothetical protein